MKISFILFLIIPVLCSGEKLDCKDVRVGLYKMHGLYGSLHTIVRTGEKQVETLGRSATVIESDIEWTSDCSFILFNHRVVKGHDSLMTITAKDTLYNEIKEVNSYWHTIICSVNRGEPIKEFHFFNIDTILRYKDLNALEKYRDFNGGYSRGTLIGYNYAITCKQHSTDTNNFVIAFLEAIIINEKAKFKILDDIYCYLDTNQKITMSNCRFNEKYDKEIVAIYSSANKNEEAVIVKAWRFNKLRLRIEEVPVELVKYKVADKFLTIWDEKTFEEFIEEEEIID